MKKQFFTFAFIIAVANNAVACNELPFFDKNNKEAQWKFIEKKFITDTVTAKQWWNNCLNYMIAAGALSFGAYNYNKYNDKNQDQKQDFIKKALETQNVYAALTSATTLYIANQLYQTHAKQSVNYHIVADFFANWEENLHYIPAELYDGLKAIADLMEEEREAFIITHADQIVEIVQFFVKRHFEKRYEKSLQMEAALSLGDAKTMTEILKNTVETATKFSSQK